MTILDFRISFLFNVMSSSNASFFSIDVLIIMCVCVYRENDLGIMMFHCNGQYNTPRNDDDDVDIT